MEGLAQKKSTSIIGEAAKRTGCRTIGQMDLVACLARAIAYAPDAPPMSSMTAGAGGKCRARVVWVRTCSSVPLLPGELHLEQAGAFAAKSGVAPASVKRGDARHLDFAVRSADALLLLRPLHLIERADRLQALVEARRVLKPEGVLFAASSRRPRLGDGSISRGLERRQSTRKTPRIFILHRRRSVACRRQPARDGHHSSF
jgi:SAM-dependent methyltransferase